jgi:hypothetical protein
MRHLPRNLRAEANAGPEACQKVLRGRICVDPEGGVVGRCFSTHEMGWSLPRPRSGVRDCVPREDGRCLCWVFEPALVCMASVRFLEEGWSLSSWLALRGMQRPTFAMSGEATLRSGTSRCARGPCAALLGLDDNSRCASGPTEGRPSSWSTPRKERVCPELKTHCNDGRARPRSGFRELKCGAEANLTP